MKEIVNIQDVGKLFLILAILGPILGALFGGFLGSRKGDARKGLIGGLCVGLLATANWGMWKAYNLQLLTRTALIGFPPSPPISCYSAAWESSSAF